MGAGERGATRARLDSPILVLVLSQLALFGLDLLLPRQLPLVAYSFIPVVLGSAIAARRQRQEQRLRASEERYRLLAENVSDVVVLIDPQGRVRWVSPSLTHAFGWMPAEWIGRPYPQLPATTADQEPGEPIWPEPGERARGRQRFRAKDGTVHWCEALIAPSLDRDGRQDGWICSLRAIDLQVANEEALSLRARTDPLTPLLNREEGFRQIERLSGLRSRTGPDLALLFCDLDQFKLANDTFGHQAGDTVLKVIAQRIRTCLRSTDLAVRIGGDELLVALPGVHGLTSALAIADKVRQLANQPIAVPGGVVRISLSIGVALAHPDESIDVLVARADRAMYIAKREGGDRVTAIPAPRPPARLASAREQPSTA